MNRNRKIVLVNQSSGFLVVDNVNACVEKYDKVALICGYLSEGERKIDPSVKVESIYKYNKSSGIKRLWSWLWGSLQIFFKLLFKYRGYEVMYFTNPPIACFGSLLLPNKFSIVVYDIYPDALKTIGINSSSAIYKIWGRINRRLFSKADRIITLSEGMKKCLAQYGSAEKIISVPLWSGSDNFKPIAKERNSFVKEHGLQNKFVVLYSGNIGYTHSVEVLVKVADKLKYDESIRFLIIGDGKKKQEIADEVNKRGLENITLLPYQDFRILPYSLASADIGVITLDENVAQVSVPSKTFNLMAVGAPLLAIANEETEINRLVTKYNNGKCIQKHDIDGIVRFIEELKSSKNLKERFVANSLIAAKDFTYKNARLYFDF